MIIVKALFKFIFILVFVWAICVLVFGYSCNYEIPVITKLHSITITHVQPELKYTNFIEIKKAKKFSCFYERLGYYESRGRYNIVNKLGYMGKYQFDIPTLNWIGFNVSRSEFLNSSTLQEKAVRKYVRVNRKLLKSYIDKYANSYFTLYNGSKVYITESGILGGAHLGGYGSVKRFFNTRGRVNNKDKNGTSVLAYIKVFNNTSI